MEVEKDLELKESQNLTRKINCGDRSLHQYDKLKGALSDVFQCIAALFLQREGDIADNIITLDGGTSRIRINRHAYLALQRWEAKND
jgi:hypothetical protein